MGLGSIFGIGKEIAEPVEAVGNALDKLFTSDDEKLTKQEILERTRQNPAMWQIELNKVEAGHRTIFVAGWRPFIGWVCGFAFAYHFIFQPFLTFILSALGVQLSAPTFDMDSLSAVLMGMLGLGGLRSFEKSKRLTK